MVKLWSLAVDRTDDPCFGLTVGKQWHPTSWHALGYAWFASATLEEAFKRLARCSAMITTAGEFILEERSAYTTWASVFSREYKALVTLTQRGKTDTMDQYGATNPAEFFAVATETFFEKPRQLKEGHPELYEELLYYYKVNPMDWVES